MSKCSHARAALILGFLVVALLEDPPARELPVELPDPATRAGAVLWADGIQRDCLAGALCGPRVTGTPARRWKVGDFLHRIPGAAIRTLTAPLGEP